MHESVLSWVAAVVDEFSLRNRKVLEVGSLVVNGTVRECFKATTYVGIDMRPGPGVDIVMNSQRLDFPDESFDIVVSTETLEHDDRFWLSMAEMGRVLRKGGCLIVTARGNGFPLHGYPDDFYRFMPSSVGVLFKLAGVDLVLSQEDPQVAGVFGIGFKPLPITVVMPVHAGMRFIDESVQSVKKQTMSHWEMLIGVNGHEKDSEMYRYARKYETANVRVFDLYWVSGYANAMNALVKRANNDRIALIDQDDVWLPEKLLAQLPYLATYDVVASMAEHFGTRTGIIPIPAGELRPAMFREINPIVNPTAIVKRLDADWDARYEGVCDYELWSRLALAGRRMFNVPKVLARHRIHPESAYNNTTYTEKIAEIGRRMASA